LFLEVDSAAGIRGISASCITRAGGPSLPPAFRQAARTYFFFFFEPFLAAFLAAFFLATVRPP
jgi:hypothetical protein